MYGCDASYNEGKAPDVSCTETRMDGSGIRCRAVSRVVGGVAIAGDGDVFYACERGGNVSSIRLNQEPNCKRGATVVSWADGVDGQPSETGPPGPAAGISVQYVNVSEPLPPISPEGFPVEVAVSAVCPDGTVLVGGGYTIGSSGKRTELLDNVMVRSPQLNWPDNKYQVNVVSRTTKAYFDVQLTAACAVANP